MSYEKVRLAKNIIIGTKQTVKAIRKGIVSEIIIAEDTEERIIAPVLEEARRYHIKVTSVHSRKNLGEACGIDVNAAVVAITV